MTQLVSTGEILSIGAVTRQSICENGEQELVRDFYSTTIRTFTLTLVATASSMALSAGYAIQWLDMSATAPGGLFASGSVYSLPGYGNVPIDYTSNLPPAPQNWIRGTLEAGSVLSGGNTYSWSGVDTMEGVNGFGGAPTQTYTITFSFLNGAIGAQELVLGSYGLGRKDPSKTFVQVFRPATNFGDWDLGPNSAPTLFTPISGGFQLENSVPEPNMGFFNTDFNVVRIDDSATTLVLNVTHIAEDGIGFSIGRIVPAPLPGDYNNNGVVDGADYVLWRKNNNTATTLPNDSTPGTDQSDYDVWRAHFGQPPGSGTGAIANAAVPEPATLLQIVLVAAVVSTRRRRAI